MEHISEKEAAMLEKLKNRYKKQYEQSKNNYDRIGLALPVGSKQAIEEAAKNSGVSINEFCKNAILAALE